MIGNPTMVAALVDSAATDAERRHRSADRADNAQRPDLPTWNGLGPLFRARRSATHQSIPAPVGHALDARVHLLYRRGGRPVRFRGATPRRTLALLLGDKR